MTRSSVSLRGDEGPTGLDVLLKNPALNKSTAFTEEERRRYKLRGLLLPAVCSQEMQLSRALENLRRQTTDIERYISLQALLSRNERLFYRLVVDHIDEIMPLIYTPTVGQACQEFAHIFRQTRGLYVTAQDRGHVREILENWPYRDMRVIVMTDGERILGLGDLGANGMGIPIGKLSLYTALAGIYPDATLPIMLDVGTNNAELRSDPLYLGLRISRIGAREYFDLVDELISALQAAYPDAMLQFEDFATPNAYALLNRYRRRLLCFNHDIQDTAAMALAGVYASSRLSGVSFRDMRVMFLGAGSAANGIADLMVEALLAEGLPSDEAVRRLWFVDLRGLVVKERHRGTPTAQSSLRARSAACGLADRSRQGATQRLDWRIRCDRKVFAGGYRVHGSLQRAPGNIRSLEPHIQSRAHCRAGLSVERWTCDFCEWQPVRSRKTRRPNISSWPEQQRVHLPRHRPRSHVLQGNDHYGRDVPRCGENACCCREPERDRTRHAVSASPRLARDLCFHRSRRRPGGLRHRAREGTEAAQPRANDSGKHV